MPIDLGGKWKAAIIQLITEHWTPPVSANAAPAHAQLLLFHNEPCSCHPVSCQQKHPPRPFYHQIVLHFCANKYKLPWVERTCAVLPPLALYQGHELSGGHPL